MFFTEDEMNALQTNISDIVKRYFTPKEGETYPAVNEGLYDNAVMNEPANDQFADGIATAARGLGAGKLASRGLNVFGLGAAATGAALDYMAMPWLKENPTAMGTGTALIGTPLYLGAMSLGMSNSPEEALDKLRPENLIGKGVPQGAEFAVAAETLSRSLGIPLREAVKMYGNYLTGNSISKRSGLTDYIKDGLPDYQAPDEETMRWGLP